MQRTQKKSRLSESDSDGTKSMQEVAISRQITTGIGFGDDKATKCSFVDMPLDILLEIYSHLWPADLIRLSRVNKFHHGILLSKSSKAIWRVSRNNVPGLPERPAHLSEFAYARLIFDQRCHNCGTSGPHNVIWEFSARYCDECLKAAELIYPEHVISTAVGGIRQHLPEDFDWTIYLLPLTAGDNEQFYLQKTSDAFIERIHHLRSNQGALGDYLIALKQETDTLEAYTAACKQWYIDCMKRRLTSVTTKLREEGWDKYLDKMEGDEFLVLKAIPAICDPEDLTDYEWTRIRGSIIQVMEDYKEACLEEERRELIRSRLQDLRQVINTMELGQQGRRTADSETSPKFADAALMPEVRALAEAPNDVSISQEDFDKVCIEHLPGFTQSWKMKCTLELGHMMAVRLGRPWDAANPRPSDVLGLAIAWFRCDRCQKNFRYPNVLAHLCLRTPYGDVTDASIWENLKDGIHKDDHFDDPYERDVASISTLRPWSAKGLRPAPDEDLLALRKIIEACGLDPGSATAEEMDEADARVTCDTIPVMWKSKSEGHLVMNWRRAVLMIAKLRYLERLDGAEWARVSEEDRLRARALERKAVIDMWDEYQKYKKCALCDETWWFFGKYYRNHFLISHHMKSVHKERLLHIDYIEAGLVYVHPDGSPEVPTEVWVAFPPKPVRHDYGEYPIEHDDSEDDSLNDPVKGPGIGAQVLGWVRGLLNY